MTTQPEPTDFPGSGLPQIVPTAAALAELGSLAEQMREHRERRVSENTRRYHVSDWNQYGAWCQRLGLRALTPGSGVDPAQVGLYLTDLARLLDPDGAPHYKVSSLARFAASISRKHYEVTGMRGLGTHPEISEVLAGIRRLRQEPVTRKRPLLLDDVRTLLASMEYTVWPLGVTAARDRLAILLGFGAARRREEVSAFHRGDVLLHPTDGLHVRLRRSKSDQEGHGHTLAIPFGTSVLTCAPCALVRWIQILDAPDRAAKMRLLYAQPADVEQWRHICRTGVAHSADADRVTTPLLRVVNKVGEIGEDAPSGSALNEIVKRRLAAVGYNPDPYGFHSLRSGFVTQARRNGADHRAVRRQTLHASDGQVDVYDREFNPLEGSAVTVVGL